MSIFNRQMPKGTRMFSWVAIAFLASSTIYWAQKIMTPALVTSSYAGVVPATFQVNAGGDAQYSIPLTVPPGTANLSPDLSVVYTSNSRDGLMGVGFQLNGFSVINRVASTEAQDGVAGSLNFDANDRFALDGSRLIGTQGIYGANLSEYHTELESWTKVIANGSNCGSGPCWFKVIEKNGVIKEYGNTTDSRIYSSTNSGVRVWALNKITDLNGNYLTITYQQEPQNGSYYPTSIQYTGNTNTGLTPQRAVTFDYQTRADTLTVGSGGGIIKNRKLISAINTWVQNQPALKYKFTYETSRSTFRSLLTKMEMCAANGACLPAQTFDWSQNNPDLINDAVAMTTQMDQGQLIPLDINADGLADIANVKKNKSTDTYPSVIESWLSNAQEFGKTQTLNFTSLGSSSFYAADFNADGRLDILNSANIGKFNNQVFLSKGAGGFNAPFTYNGPTSGMYYGTSSEVNFNVGDVNADGKSDMIYGVVKNYNDSASLQITCFLSTGTSFTQQTTQKISLKTQTGGKLYSGDFNADGRTDLAYITSAYNSANTLQSTIFLCNTQNQFVAGDKQSFPFYKGSSGQVVLADANGDGNTDVVYSYLQDSLYLTTLLSNGENLYLSAKDHHNSPGAGWIMPTDVNGDGLSDLTYINSSNTSQFQFYMFLSNGINYSNKTNFTESNTSPEYNPIPMDFNGDALSDIVYVKSISGNTPKYTFSRFMATGPYPDVVTSFNNGMGGEYAINYRPLTDTLIYRKSAIKQSLPYYVANTLMSIVSGATYVMGSTSSPSTGATFLPVATVQFPKYCVASYAKYDGTGNRYGYGFFYSGAKVAHNGRGWLGFAQKTIVDSSALTRNVSSYHQVFPLTGHVYSSTVSNLQNQRYKQYLIHYEQPDVSFAATGNKTYQVFRKSVRLEHYDQGTYAFTTGQDYRYDEYGNTTMTINLGDLNQPKNVVYTLNTYNNDLERWRLGFLTQTQMSSDSTGKDTLSLVIKSFDNTTSNLLSVSHWDNSNHNYLDTLYRYDTYGNPTQSILPTGDTSFTVYDQVYHTFPIKNISPPNQWGKKLSSSSAYDPRSGLVTLSINANGDSSITVYDGLYRDSLIYGPDPDGNLALMEKTFYLPNPDFGYTEESSIRLDWAGQKWETEQQVYDGLGRSIVSMAPGQGNKKAITLTRYNSRDKAIARTMPYFEGDQQYWQTIRYDPIMRVTQVTLPKSATDSITMQITYQGKSIKLTEAVGTPDEVSTSVLFDFYDSQQCYTRLINKNGDTTRLAYDLRANLIGFTDPKGISTQQEFNTLNQTIKTIDSSLGTSRYFYDYQAGTYTVVNAKGDTVTTQFDALGRKINEWFPDGSQYKMLYDLPSHSHSQGQLSVAYFSEEGYYSYSYDNLGNIDSLVTYLDGQYFLEVGTYNPDGSINRYNMPDGSVVNYAYTDQALLQSISMTDAKANNSSKTYASYPLYDASNKVLSAVYGNNTTTTYQYTPTGRIKKHQVANNSSSFINDLYYWNNVGTLDSIIDLVESGSLSQRFTYDNAGRLMTAKGIYGNKTYTYDKSGNLNLKDNTHFNYNNYQVVSGTLNNDTLFWAQYDVVGNMLRKTAIKEGDTTDFHYAYDALNQLVAVTLNGDSLYRFAYDQDGRRVSKYDYATGIKSLYASSNYELAIYPDSTLATKYVFSPNGLVASVTHSSAPPSAKTVVHSGLPTTGTLYFYQNIISSTLFTANDQGQPVSRLVYTPYGSIYQQSGTGPDNYRYKFAGKELDEASDLYYFSARYYDPHTGRFITADTQLGGSALKADVLNRYAYVLNNPVSNSDPSGHGVIEDAIVDVAVVAVTVVAEAAIDVATLGAATPEEVALDAGVIAAEVTVDATTDAAVDAGIDATTDALVDVGVDESSSSLWFDFTGEGSEESLTGDATSKLENTDYGDMSSCTCFTEGQVIETTQGARPIETLGVGDTVVSYDEKERLTAPNRIRETFRRTADTVLLLYVAGRTIEATPNHPFYVKKQWVPARDLQPGDMLSSLDKSLYRLDSVKHKLGAFRVYNFEVARAHTYYVSDLKILVHNPRLHCSSSRSNLGQPNRSNLGPTKTITKPKVGKNFVYKSVDSNGTVNYIGITNDIKRRGREHLRKKGISIQPIFNNISREDARALEQALIEKHGLGKNGGTLLNKINSISPKNRNYLPQITRGNLLLQSSGH